MAGTGGGMEKTTELVLFQAEGAWFGVPTMPGLQIGSQEPDVACDFYTLFTPALPVPHSQECIILPHREQKYGLWVAKVIKIQHKTVTAMMTPMVGVPIIGYTFEGADPCLVLDFWELFA